MNQSTPFYRFIDLVQCDQLLVQCQKEQVVLQKNTALLVQQKDAEQSLLNAVQKKLHDARKERDMLDLNIASLRSLKQKTEKKLESVANPREYTVLHNELQQCQEKIEATEELLIKQWDLIERAEEEVKTAQQIFQNKIALLETKEAELEQQQKNLEEQCAQWRQKRIGMEIGLPEDWMINYHALRERVDNPAVEVKNGICSGCFFMLPVNLMGSLKRHVLVPCPHCKRIVYQA